MIWTSLRQCLLETGLSAGLCLFPWRIPQSQSKFTVRAWSNWEVSLKGDLTNRSWVSQRLEGRYWETPRVSSFCRPGGWSDPTASLWPLPLPWAYLHEHSKRMLVTFDYDSPCTGMISSWVFTSTTALPPNKIHCKGLWVRTSMCQPTVELWAESRATQYGCSTRKSCHVAWFNKERKHHSKHSVYSGL